MMTEENGALVKLEPPKTVGEVFTGEYAKGELEKFKGQYCDPTTMLRLANTAVVKNGKLQQCTPVSFFNCLIDLAAVGLAPDGRHAHLIPYGKDCVLQIDYKGYVQIILRDPDVKTVHAQIVCENDVFEYDAPTSVVKKHTIDFKKPRGEMYAAYTCVTYKDGTCSHHVEAREKIESIRAQSSAWKRFKKDGTKCPWNTHPEPMWMKTVLHQHKKWLNLTADTHEKLIVEDKYQFPQYQGQDSITGDDIKDMADGSRRKIQPPPVKDAETEEPPTDKISQEQVKRLYTIAIGAGWDKPEVKKLLKEKYNVDSAKDVTVAVYDKVIEDIQEPATTGEGE